MEPVTVTRVHTTRVGLVDNSLEVGGPMKLGAGKYMRHIPSGRIYPYAEEGAKREDVEIFVHTPDGRNVKVNKPPKQKRKGPFQVDRAVGFESPSDNIVLVNDNLQSPE